MSLPRVLVRPAQLHLGTGLFPMRFGAQPLEVRQLIPTAADQGFPMVDLPPRASSGFLASGRARIGLAELSADRAGADYRSFANFFGLRSPYRSALSDSVVKMITARSLLTPNL